MTALLSLERFFGWLLQTTWQAAVIAVLILLVQVLLRNRLSPAWRHGLWLLLVARLVMPMTPRSALSVFNFLKWSQPQITKVAFDTPPPGMGYPSTDMASSEVDDATRLSASQPAPHLEPVPQPDTITSSLGVAPVTHTASSPSKSFNWRSLKWTGLGTLLWLGGVLVLGIRFFCTNRVFKRRLHRCPLVSDGLVKRLFKECVDLLQLKRPPLLVETEEVESPAVYGLWRKRLLLPDGLRQELSTEELRHIFLHELAHIKRRDPELNWLLAILQILHWFNPVLWFAFARMRADREIATDELALQFASEPNRSSYGETIVKVLESLSERQVLPGLVGIGESKARIKERIRAIAQGGVGNHWRWAAVVVALVIAGVALTSAREDNQANGVNLLECYPTSLTAGDATAGRARPWRFTEDDIFRVSRFSLEIGKQLRVEVGASDLGIGHCNDGAVWAVLIPHEGGKLTRLAPPQEEIITHLWLRFHPAQINLLFPPETVSGAGSPNLEEKMRAVAGAKFTSSWHAGNNAMIPEAKDMTVDADTRNGPRRFFVVDKEAQSAEYVEAFAGKGLWREAEPAAERELDTNCARVVAVSPADESTQVDPNQKLRVRFDRPMDPHNLKLEWLEGGFQLNGSIEVLDDRKEFIIPLRLTPGQDQKLVVNRDQEWERWQALGRRPDMKPSRSSRSKEGFRDPSLVPANEFRWSFSTRDTSPKPGAPKPRVVSVSPASGSATPVLTLVEVTFDQPMRPASESFPYLQQAARMEGPSLIPSFDYDAKARRFTFPALLRPDDDVRLTLRGFCSAEGVGCESVVLHYQTGNESLDAGYLKRARESAKDPKLRRLLASMKEARAKLNSGVETVQTINLGLSKSSFNSVAAQTATFKWQGNDKVYADISGPMSMKAFILGNDGQNCWLYSVNKKDEPRLDKTPVSITRREVFLLDPFDLGKSTIPETLADKQMVSASDAVLEGRPCHRVQKWDVSQDNFVYATLTEWWIDAETFLPKQIVQSAPHGCQIVRFDCRDLNQRLAESEFQPPVSPGSDNHPLFFAKEPEPDEQRFLRISDGANGRMSGRLGWHGSKGTTSSGLN